MTEILERDVPEQFVLTEQRTVAAPDVKEWLTEAMDRQFGTAQAINGLTGSWFVVYHGQFTDETPEIPVEVCGPVAPDQAGDLATRVEPAHREAYLRLKKHQFTNPAEIANAFATVAQWVAKQGYTISDAPREVYFTDLMAAADDEDVCDIAFPIR
ncbi:GyrI-like domain-containing protein [Amycolatopsis japonica]|uniref:GyrI-like domain-containing protein n=1 Tax=Amycolatopsis japonica TaxID=208439 RepID=UPI00331F64CB